MSSVGDCLCVPSTAWASQQGRGRGQAGREQAVTGVLQVLSPFTGKLLLGHQEGRHIFGITPLQLFTPSGEKGVWQISFSSRGFGKPSAASGESEVLGQGWPHLNPHLAPFWFVCLVEILRWICLCLESHFLFATQKS